MSGIHRTPWLARLVEINGPYCHYCGRRVVQDHEWIPSKVRDHDGQRFVATFGAPAGLRLPTRDHVLPRSRGGSNKPENIVLACHSCNSQKRAKTADEYRVWLEDKWGHAITFWGDQPRKVAA